MKAQRNAWLVGDNFLKQIHNTFLAMRDQARAERKPVPYIFDNYNVDFKIPGSIAAQSSSAIACILNNLIDAINREQLLPRFIIICPDWNILQAINYYDLGVSKIIGANLEWLIREVDPIIPTKKIELKAKQSGAVFYTEPKIVWIHMITCPYPSRVLALRKKFNAILEETLSKTRGMFIMDVQDKISSCFFDRANYLTATRRMTYWKNVDDNIKETR